MLNLNDINEWKKLDSPFDNSEDIPSLIEKLKQTFDKEILNELTSEYMYHQGSLYGVTFATFPYLIEISESTINQDYRLETLISLSVILSEFGGKTELKSIFLNSKCKKETIEDIIKSFENSSQKLHPIALSLMEFIETREEYEKKYFLLALAVANEIYQVSTIFWRYAESDEFECCCPNCKDIMLISKDSKKDEFFLHKEYPFEKNATKFTIEPKIIDKSNFSERISFDKNIQWLNYYIEKFNIKSLKTVIKYIFGNTNCPNCNTKFKIFDNIPT
ncbi:MAG: hypothetical protein ACK5MK_09265 [Dysgonomonas sp.]